MKRQSPIDSLSGQEIQRIAEDLYVYGYPLLVMDLMKRTHTATSFAVSGSAPLNQFVHERLFSEAHCKRAAHRNADCLRSSAWLDLSKDCVVLSVPSTSRHYLLSFFSEWYEIFASISPRNTGMQGVHLGFVGPHWHGRLPANVKRVAAPTESVWIDGWLEAACGEDIESVHRVQDQLHLTLLSDWGAPPTSHSLPFRVDVDHKTTPQEQVAGLDTRGFYTRLSRLMRKNQAPACDAESVAAFARIGFFPQEDFAFEMLPPETTQAMHAAVAAAQSKIADAEKAAVNAMLNKWSLHVHPGHYETNYLDRAAAARMGMASALAEDILCFHTAVDQSGERLSGANRYVITFRDGFWPPVDAFWSITLFDAREHLVPNGLHRNVIGDRNRLKLDAGRALSIPVQHDWPGATTDSNWLPAPKEAFHLALRMYSPKLEALNGNWQPPGVMRTN